MASQIDNILNLTKQTNALLGLAQSEGYRLAATEDSFPLDFQVFGTSHKQLPFDYDNSLLKSHFRLGKKGTGPNIYIDFPSSMNELWKNAIIDVVAYLNKLMEAMQMPQRFHHRPVAYLKNKSQLYFLETNNLKDDVLGTANTFQSTKQNVSPKSRLGYVNMNAQVYRNIEANSTEHGRMKQALLHEFLHTLGVKHYDKDSTSLMHYSMSHFTEGWWKPTPNDIRSLVREWTQNCPLNETQKQSLQSFISHQSTQFYQQVASHYQPEFSNQIIQPDAVSHLMFDMNAIDYRLSHINVAVNEPSKGYYTAEVVLQDGTTHACRGKCFFQTQYDSNLSMAKQVLFLESFVFGESENLYISAIQTSQNGFVFDLGKKQNSPIPVLHGNIYPNEQLRDQAAYQAQKKFYEPTIKTKQQTDFSF